ncbi:uncharacterized protein LOC118884386 [Balaenoptera musculus]|uniref:Uncharacterized protein LOC118884386 n=1 Tax=Balaenoptera musculus TaxID=9771 RepID=A0A8B8VSQ2_BALMU|nr:uncharacterized protein LOC118884386 [Balaenoptera musculus]
MGCRGRPLGLQVHGRFLCPHSGGQCRGLNVSTCRHLNAGRYPVKTQLLVKDCKMQPQDRPAPLRSGLEGPAAPGLVHTRRFVSLQKQALGILPEAPTPLTILTLSAGVLARSWKNPDVKIGSRLVIDVSLMGCVFAAVQRTYSCDSGKLWSLWLWPNGRKNCFFTAFSGYSPGRLCTVCLSRRRCPGTCVLNKTDVCSPRPSVLQRPPALLGRGLLAPVTAWPGCQGLLWVGPFSASGATSV